MTTLAEHIIVAGAGNRPPMLEKSMYDSWASREDPIKCINKARHLCLLVASRRIATTSKGNYAAGQPRVVKCCNCQGEGHMANRILNEEQLAFLADPGISEAPVAQQTIA
ncbi:hypothetical protein Tco_1420974 [Tanacetum coccineum]